MNSTQYMLKTNQNLNMTNRLNYDLIMCKQIHIRYEIRNILCGPNLTVVSVCAPRGLRRAV